MIIRKSPREIEQMAKAGELVHETIHLVGEHLQPGVSMLELDRIAEEHIQSRGGVPTSKGYKGFPATLCISPRPTTRRKPSPKRAGVHLCVPTLIFLWGV